MAGLKGEAAVESERMRLLDDDAVEGDLSASVTVRSDSRTQFRVRARRNQQGGADSHEVVFPTMDQIGGVLIAF